MERFLEDNDGGYVNVRHIVRIRPTADFAGWIAEVHAGDRLQTIRLDQESADDFLRELVSPPDSET